MAKSKSPGTISRRNFTLSAAAAATAALLPVGEASAQTPESAAMAKLSPTARAEAEAKVNEIFRKYGSRLSEEQKADVRKVMAETQAGLEKMRTFVLTNGDQPATAFQLYESSGK